MNHEHAVCNSKIEQHVHKKDIDCKVHLIKHSTALLTLDLPNILSEAIIIDFNSEQYYYLKNHHQLSFSLRGPPLSV
ncbi:hypothetical protein BW723_11945 [Polaribacter reichenbachii]|uniref:Uncharacterized protein n=1 Tax=Polaribacter reichenbachii TaxID=996801 RepID=A0A1B8TPH7_9FLAO|nr:hypothetical protein [Polaribacter reichenbachii]APZ46951.1 hypothetical protein BW723_11945 [Polaribacter reichenbachii]AUC17594.1 hypothetical protein BTO17_02395 [Polaribacter reichenbachii]OBY61533.1 hypothetical protein LPB301_15830 [Polaribacter reichenbachii]